MNIASLDLCKELYELTGWDGAAFSYFLPDDYGDDYILPSDSDIGNGRFHAPAYALGYLLRKLPPEVMGVHSYRFRLTPVDVTPQNGFEWSAGYTDRFELFQFHDRTKKSISLWFKADTPEAATAKLAIELFKQGV